MSPVLPGSRSRHVGKGDTKTNDTWFLPIEERKWPGQVDRLLNKSVMHLDFKSRAAGSPEMDSLTL